MEVGLLVCGEPAEEYRNSKGDYVAMFSRAFPSIDFIGYNIFKGDFPTEITNLGAYFMTGSRYSVYDDYDWIKKGKDLIRNIHQENLKFVGVCFGHQMMAEALGGQVKKASTGWNVGIKEFEILKQKSWMDPKSTHFSIQMMCQDQVIMLPPMAENLASISDCQYGMISIGDHMLSVQGHPEFPLDYHLDLIHSRIKRIGEVKSNQAISTLKEDHNLELIKKYIINFLLANQ